MTGKEFVERAEVRVHLGSQSEWGLWNRPSAHRELTYHLIYYVIHSKTQAHFSTQCATFVYQYLKDPPSWEKEGQEATNASGLIFTNSSK